MVEGARLERVCIGNGTEGSNPSLSVVCCSFIAYSISTKKMATGQTVDFWLTFSPVAFLATVSGWHF